jgi:hypothetical protein
MGLTEYGCEIANHFDRMTSGVESGRIEIGLPVSLQ